ncbi:hypothetical protein Vretifemale_7666 [Volvox reticuliferus]|nr:hypothetical protein Vretifemale_7666 [Volvox reticuliferus]
MLRIRIMKLGSIFICTFLIINLVRYSKAAGTDDVISLRRTAVLQRERRQTAAARRLLLGSVSKANTTQSDALINANIRTGQELIAALADPFIRVITLIVPSVTVTPEDWNSSSIGLPIELRRNVTLEGSNEWPQLNLKYIRGTIRLGGTVRMTFMYMHVYMEGLLGKPSRLAGTDIFTPTDHGPPSEVWFVSVSMYSPYCFAGYLHTLDVLKIPRPPQYPGTQEFVDVNQTGCVNTTTAPPLQRCWVDKSYAQDWAFEGNDIDPVTSAVRHSNLLFRFLNSTFVCQFQVDPACTAIKDPMICYGETVNKYNDLSSDGSSSGSYTRSPTVFPQQPPSNSSSSTGSSRNDGGLQPSRSSGSTSGVDKDVPGAVLPVQASVNGNSSRAALVIGASVGASILAIIAAVAVGLAWRRCHQPRQDQPSPLTAAECSQPDLPIDASAVTITTAAAAATSAGTAACEVPKAAFANLASAVAPPVTNKTPPALNIPLNVTLVQLHLQQPTIVTAGSGIDGSMMPPAAPPGGSLTESAAREGCQVILRVAGGARAATAAGLEAIDELLPLKGPNGGEGGNIIAVAASGGDGDEKAIFPQIAAEGPGGCSVSHSISPLPRANIALDASRNVVMAPREYSRSNYDFLTSESSESGSSSGEGDGIVGLLPVVLGKGAFGRVVEGMYKGRRVAVKLMASEEPWADVSANTFTRTFAHEVEVLSRCAHPNVVQLLAARVTPPRLCLVMELMDTSLARLIHHNTDESEMPLPKVLHIGICIANALAYLHPTIVHRDLKPANVLINNPQSDKPIAKLTDFGLSRLRITVGSTEHPDAGTPPYMAPECFDVSNRRITHQADIYSLGVLLWEMLARTRPWKDMGPAAVGFMVTYKGVRLPLDCLSGSRCPHKLARLLVACWDADPARRPAAAEVAKELTLVLQNVERQGGPNYSSEVHNMVQGDGKR